MGTLCSTLSRCANYDLISIRSSHYATSITMHSYTPFSDLYEAIVPSRTFITILSTSPRHEQRTTRARRGLFRWLQTVGQNFANPLESSTNYLSAYNTLGQLKRVVAAAKDNERAKGQTGSSISADGSKNSSPDGGKASTEIPPESIRDLKPFPLN